MAQHMYFTFLCLCLINLVWSRSLEPRVQQPTKMYMDAIDSRSMLLHPGTFDRLNTSSFNWTAPSIPTANLSASGPVCDGRRCGNPRYSSCNTALDNIPNDGSRITMGKRSTGTYDEVLPWYAHFESLCCLLIHP